MYFLYSLSHLGSTQKNGHKRVRVRGKNKALFTYHPHPGPPPVRGRKILCSSESAAQYPGYGVAATGQ
jgi:hypothetical protein